jgi:hypothetical protein
MIWLTLLGILLPLLIQLIGWLSKSTTAPTSPRVIAKLAQFKSLCRQGAGECDRLGIPEQGETT